MGYLHIDNFYKDRDIILFKEAYALEKIHGTSAHVAFDEHGNVKFFAGGVPHEQFVAIFDVQALQNAHQESYKGMALTVYGEAYGGKCQKMSQVYGKDLKFVAFDVKINDSWLDVPNAEQVSRKLGFDFVPYEKIDTSLASIEAQKNRPSVQAEKNGMGIDKWREGIVLRPLIEVVRNNGKRLICKHKREDARETKTPREVSPDKLQMLTNANAIAEEWVTHTRLQHVLDKLTLTPDMSVMPQVISAMVEDVKRESAGETEWSREASTAIGRKTAILMKEYLQQQLRQNME